MMRVVAALGALDLKTRRDHRAVDIDGEAAKLEPRQDLCDHRGIERRQMLHALHREALEQAAHRARRRPHPNSSETMQQRIVGQVLQVLEAAPPHHQRPDQHAHHRDHAEVSARLAQGRAHQLAESDPRQIPVEQLQSRVRGELRLAELERQIPIDTSMQIGVLRLTVSGLSFVEEALFGTLLSTTTKGLFQFIHRSCARENCPIRVK
jgi:hypothetical protein